MRTLHRSLVVVALTLALCACLGALSAKPAAADERSRTAAGDVCTDTPHADPSIVTVRLRPPVPSTALAAGGAHLGPSAAVTTGDHDRGAPHRHTPLYALLRVYRL